MAAQQTHKLQKGMNRVNDFNNKKKYSLKMVLAMMLLATALTSSVFLLVLDRELGLFSKRFAAVHEYAALLTEIEEQYIGEFNLGEVSANANGAAVYALGDRWSFYMTAAEYASYLNSSDNKFIGIGVNISIDEETQCMRVLSLHSNSPAEKAGIMPGDIIIGIDDESIAGLDLEEVRARLSRNIGDKVLLNVKRENGKEETVTVIYDIIFTNPVSYEMLEDKIGYIKITNFEGESASGFIEASKKLIEQGATAFIYDVRDNNGGRVTEMTAILDYLLPEGEIFVSVDKSGKEYSTMSGPGCVNLPAAVLFDRYSYSAAEYFAATLGEYNYATTVGEQSTGKNRSQITITLPGGSALHISSGEYLTKNRISLYDQGGLTPQYQIPLPDDKLFLLTTNRLEKSDDPQLQKAIEVVKGIR